MDFCSALGHSRGMDLLNLSIFILVPALVIFLALLTLCLLGYGVFALARRMFRRSGAPKAEDAQ